MGFVCLLNKASVFFAVFLVGYGAKLADIREGPVANKSCRSTVTEGQTAAIPFSVSNDSLLYDDFFAHIRRKDYPGSDIVICDRESPVKCTVSNERYKSGQIVNNSLTLLIPNVTRDFDDTYVLQVYANSVPQPRSECHLTVIAKKPENLRCLDSEVAAGETAKLNFFVSQDVLSQPNFFALLRRDKNPMSDILVCGRNSPVKCEVHNPGFMSGDIDNGWLTLIIPNATKEFEDTYVFRAYVGRKPQPPDHCVLRVKDIPQQTRNENLAILGVVSVAVILVTALLLISVIVIIRYRVTLRLRVYTMAPNNNNRFEAQENLLNKSPNGKLWYWTNLLPNEYERLLEFERNRVEGAFLIRRCTKVPMFYYLTVYNGERLNRFRLVKSERGISFLDTDVSFSTLTDLVAHYRKNDIVITEGTVYGRLKKPFEKKPEGSWYAGKMERAEQYSILQSEDNGPGSFLIREGILKPNSYTLVVNVQGEVHGYRISVEDDGYEFCDADGKKLFPSLSALVDHYSHNDIWVHGDNLGKLCKPAQGITGTVSAEVEEGTET